MNSSDESAVSRSEPAAGLRGDSARGERRPRRRTPAPQPAGHEPRVEPVATPVERPVICPHPNGHEPDPARVERLAQPVRRALDELQLALEPDVFSPATAERSFVVALNNFGAIALAASLVSGENVSSKHRASACPSLRPSGTLDLLNLLERGELDLVISALDAPAHRSAARTPGRRSLRRRDAPGPPGGEARSGHRGLR